MRVGIGYDLHRLVEGRRLVLGGVTIPFEKSFDAHSDGDVLIHAIIDALLGAAALGDIGRRFPDTDPQHKDADSTKLLRDVVAQIVDVGYRIVNVDSNIIAEAPKLAPHIESIRGALANVLGIEVGCVSVKAKTNEGVGPEGRGEAIAAQAVVLIERT